MIDFHESMWKYKVIKMLYRFAGLSMRVHVFTPGPLYCFITLSLEMSLILYHDITFCWLVGIEKYIYLLCPNKQISFFLTFLEDRELCKWVVVSIDEITCLTYHLKSELHFYTVLCWARTCPNLFYHVDITLSLMSLLIFHIL